MPRDLKPHKIEVVAHPNGRQFIDLLFDREKKVFFGTIGMERVEHTDVNDARKLVRDLLVRAPSYTWEPIIVVTGIEAEFDREHRSFGGAAEATSEFIEMEFRFYRGERSVDSTQKDRWFLRSHALDFEATLDILRKRAGHWTKRQRVEHEATKRQERAENRHLEIFYEHKSSRVLPYSDEMWRGLLAIQEAIKSARRALSALVARPDLEAKLKVFAAKPLPPMLPAYNDKAVK